MNAALAAVPVAAVLMLAGLLAWARHGNRHWDRHPPTYCRRNDCACREHTWPGELRAVPPGDVEGAGPGVDQDTVPLDGPAHEVARETPAAGRRETRHTGADTVYRWRSRLRPPKT